MSVDDIEAYITTIHNLEGISISGGEPFYQSAALNNLLERIKQRGLSVLLFTGYTIEEIHQDPDKASLLPFIDILIDGPFDESKKTNGPLLSSANQRMFFLTNRYTLLDIPAGNMEYIIDPTGTIIATGCAAP
jgi:anaerobic ribonucleoside-triphosphate reductase activating protein